MLTPSALYDLCIKEDIRFFTGVPDSLLKHFCAYITDHTRPDQHIIAVNEGAAVGLAMGHHIATGAVPLVYMQNSGLGNSINPLLSLADPEVYAIPMLLVLGWRGEPGVKDEPQHVKQGRVMQAMLDAMEIPHAILPDSMPQAGEVVHALVTRAKAESRPVALLVRKDSFESYTLQHTTPAAYAMNREEALGHVLAALPKGAVTVCTTGMLSREVFEYRARHGQSHAQDFLTVGGMGHASQIAAGMALAVDRPLFCLDGDGAMLMHMGGLASCAALNHPHFHHIVFNNAAHDSVGGQPTLGSAIDIAAIARAVGYVHAESCATEAELVRAIESGRAGPVLYEVKINKGSRADLGRPTTSPTHNKKALMQLLRGQS